MNYRRAICEPDEALELLQRFSGVNLVARGIYAPHETTATEHAFNMNERAAHTNPQPRPNTPQGPTLEDIRHRFTYHQPFGDQGDRYNALRNQMRKTAELVFELCPPSPERTRSINALQEASMLANAAIACNEKPGDMPRE